MREEFRDENLQDMIDRITPAHAGRIILRICASERAWDHPRACGKNHYDKLAKAWALGSPPRMREESKLETLTKVRVEDHPRACGKNRHGVRVGVPSYGSPPRMREESSYIK